MSPASGAGSEPPIDLAHLDRQTGGDRALAREALALFRDQRASLCARIRAGGRDGREAAHRLVGSARAIGAGRAAALAAAVEAAPEPAYADAAAALEPALDEAEAFIGRLLAEG